MKDPITGWGKNPKYYYDDEMAVCTCPECSVYNMAWPREMFGVGALDNTRGCSMWTRACTRRHKAEERRENLEWYTYTRWRSMMTQEGNKLEPIQRYKTKELTRKNDKLYQEKFLPLFSELEKDTDGNYLCPVFDIPMVLEPYEKGRPNLLRFASPSIDRIYNDKPHTIDNIQIVSWRANHLKSDATWEELETIGNWAENFIIDREHPFT